MPDAQQPKSSSLATAGATLFVIALVGVILGLVLMPAERRAAAMGVLRGSHVAVVQIEYEQQGKRLEQLRQLQADAADRVLFSRRHEKLRQEREKFNRYRESQLIRLRESDFRKGSLSM